jgi:hypothetical protein
MANEVETQKARVAVLADRCLAESLSIVAHLDDAVPLMKIVEFVEQAQRLSAAATYLRRFT